MFFSVHHSKADRASGKGRLCLTVAVLTGGLSFGLNACGWLSVETLDDSAFAAEDTTQTDRIPPTENTTDANQGFASDSNPTADSSSASTDSVTSAFDSERTTASINDSDPGFETDVAEDTLVDSHSGTDDETASDTASGSDSSTATEMEAPSDTGGDADSDTETTTALDTASHADSETETETAVDTPSDTDNGTDSDTDTATETPSDTGSSTDSDTYTETETPSDTGSGPDSDADSDSDTYTETETPSDTGSSADSATGTEYPCDPIVDLFPSPVSDATTLFPEVDDAFLNVLFTLDFTFSFYGTTYNDIYLNTNGGITFGTGEDWFNPAATTIDYPGIAIFWGDMDASDWGADTRSNQMVYQQCADRFVITYTMLQDWYESTGNNTATVTLYASGTIEIAYGTVTTTDLLVGVFDGTHTSDQYLSVQDSYVGYPSIGTGIILFDYHGVGPTHQGELSNRTVTFLAP